MNQNNLQERNSSEVPKDHLAPLKCVTPLSKYLAVTLFIILPFLGGWIGYTYAPERVVEVEKRVEVEKFINQKNSIPDRPGLEKPTSAFDEYRIILSRYKNGQTQVDENAKISRFVAIANNGSIEKIYTTPTGLILGNCNEYYCRIFGTWIDSERFIFAEFAETASHGDKPINVHTLDMNNQSIVRSATEEEMKHPRMEYSTWLVYLNSPPSDGHDGGWLSESTPDKNYSVKGSWFDNNYRKLLFINQIKEEFLYEYTAPLGKTVGSCEGVGCYTYGTWLDNERFIFIVRDNVERNEKSMEVYDVNKNEVRNALDTEIQEVEALDNWQLE